MIQFYVLMVRIGKMDINNVPELWKKDVEKELDKNEENNST